jgi:hypothetical protein
MQSLSKPHDRVRSTHYRRVDESERQSAREGSGSCRALRAGMILMAIAAISGCTRGEVGSEPAPSHLTTLGVTAPATDATSGATSWTTTDEGTTMSDHGLPLGQPGCRPASPISAGEIQGTPGSRGVQLRGLVGDVPLYTGQEVKIVWRVTGTGALRLSATDPAGHVHPPVWGPEPHTDSDFKRPGQEWGSGYVFDRPGCWQLRAERDSGWADAWIRIYPS